ncbi:MAG: hypothetical protein E6H08_14240 [Bacteroidetes bacterium]|nr:MAG: hypothetical protein E6H08_14240 [Bacteroidota bacterium]
MSTGNKAFSSRKIVFLLLALYALLQAYCIQQLSINYDEPLFAAYGITVLKFQGKKDIREFDSKLPITALNMLPRAAEQLTNPSLSKSGTEADKDIINGRYISLIISIFLGLLIFRWTSELYNDRVGLYSLLLYLLCPDFLAYGVFVSSDIFACLFFTSSFYFLWKFRQHNHLKYFILASCSVAFAQISKFSMLHLVFLFPLIQLISYKKENPGRLSFKKELFLFLIFAGINWLVISCSHFFYHEFMLLKDYHFTSEPFQKLQALLGNFPVPFPESYVSSMDAVIYFDRLGGGVPGSLNGASYILGEHSRFGFWYYYLVSIFYKLPIPTLLIWIASFGVLIFRFTRKIFLNKEIFLLVPILYFLFYLSLFYNTQVGIRHIIFIFPLLFVHSGSVINLIIKKKKEIILFLVSGWQFISVALFFPHFLPYTNELIINKKYAYKKLADSNICYGEGKKYLHQFLEANKTAVYLPDKPQAGKMVMEINEMLNMNIATINKYSWVKDLNPSGHIHSQYLIFDISPSMADSLQKLYP